MSDVRSRTGAPILDDFASSGGTPIVVDQTPGSEKLYILNDANSIVDVSGGGSSFNAADLMAFAAAHG